MDVEQLRTWLLLQPRPSKVVIVDSNADRHELEVKKTMTWKSVAESVLALDPEKIEAYDGEKLARAIKPAEMVDEDEEEEVVVTDPESQRLIVFGKLLASAYQHANQTAFTTLSDICRSMTERTQALEGALRATENIMHENFRDAVVAQARAEAAANEGDGDILGTMVKGMVHKATQEPKPNGGHS